MSDDLAVQGAPIPAASARESSSIERAVTALMIIALRGGSAVAKFGVTVFVARYLGLEALGFFGLVSGAVAVGPVMAGLGVIGVLGRDSVGRPPREVAAALVPYWLLVAGIQAVVAAACLPWAVMHDRAGLLLLVAALVFVEHLNVDVVVVLNNGGRPRLANLLLGLRTLGWIGAYAGLAFLLPGLRAIEALLLFWLAGAILALLAFGLAARDWHWRAALAAPARGARVRALVARSRTYFLNELSNTGGQYLDRYVVGALLGLEAAGIYFLFWSVTNALSNLVNTSLVQVHQPAIIRARTDPRRQRRLLGALRIEAGSTALALAAAATAIALVALAYVPRRAFADHEAVLVVLLVGFVLRVVYEVEGLGLYARHEDDRTLRSALAVLGTSLAVTAALTPVIGLTGPALAVVVSYLVGWVWRWRRNAAVLREVGAGRPAR